MTKEDYKKKYIKAEKFRNKLGLFFLTLILIQGIPLLFILEKDSTQSLFYFLIKTFPITLIILLLTSFIFNTYANYLGYKGSLLYYYREIKKWPSLPKIKATGKDAKRIALTHIILDFFRLSFILILLFVLLRKLY